MAATVASPIYHLALPQEWEAALRQGSYERSTRGRSLRDVGFVHCAYAGQVDGVARAFYADVADLLLLTIDVARLGVPVRVEDLAGTGEAFPHVYGPISVEAVAAVQPYERPSTVTPPSARI